MDYGYILRTQDTVNSVYDDRVVAQDYIYQLSGLFHQKERAIGERESFLGSLNDSILGLMSRFEKTKLTRSESEFFIDLRKNYQELTLLEQKFSLQTYPRISTQKDIQMELMEIRQNLDDLEGVQFTEGAQMTKRSTRALGMNVLLSKIELVFLVVMGAISLYMILITQNALSKVG